MMRRQAWVATSAALTLAAMLSLAACGTSSGGAGNATATTNETAVAPNPEAKRSGVMAAVLGREGPDILSTVGLYDVEPVKAIKANQGSFAIEQVNGVDTLTVNGRPAQYQEAGESASPRPATVEANNSLTLVGVFELPDESVAWALIIGGTACAGTHVLVPVRNGTPLPGASIPGCDDRGTMRAVGDRIVFDAGGAEGEFRNDLLTVQTPPPGHSPTGM